MKTKLFTLLLAVAASIGTIFAWDYEKVQIGDLYYNLDATNKTAEVAGYSSATGDFVIPASVTYNSVPYSVTSIGDDAFRGCRGLTSVTIPNSVTSIGNRAFSQCTGLTSVTIGNSVTSIGDAAFYNCTGLTSVTIPNSVTSIGDGVFALCSSLTSVTIPNSVTSIGNSAFSECTALTSVTIPNSVTSIGKYAFSSCIGLTSVTIPNSVTSIGDWAISGCKSLTSITIPNSVTSIGQYAFEDCRGLTSVTIGNNVTSIGPYAFSGCTGLTKVNIVDLAAWCKISFAIGMGMPLNYASNPLYYAMHLYLNNVELTELVFPDSCTSIGKNVFYNCSGLKSLTFGASFKVLEESAFANCTSIDTITCYSMRPPTVNTNALKGVPYSTIVYVPAAYLNNYLMHDAWGLYDVRPLGLALQLSVNIPESGVVSGAGTYAEGTIATISATPNYGYHFVQWNDGNTDNPRTITLTQDTAFVANFAPNQYTISVNYDKAYGRVEGETGQFDYKTQHTYTVIPNYGYHFTQWADGNTANPRTITLTQDTILTAWFSKNSYTITLQSADPEQGSVSGSGTFEYLEQKQISATGNYGYHFDKWSDGNKDNPRTITLTQDTILTAYFAVDKSGTCGKDNILQWSFSEDRKLTISGKGELTANYTFGVEAPTQMKTLIIGNEVTAIGERAFYGKSTINHLIIGGSVASIGDYAFAECRNFDDITCYAQDVPAINATTFANVGNKQYIYLYVPEDRERAYKRDTYWGEFDVQVKGASETTSDQNVTVTPNENSAIVTWPTEKNAATYTLQITKDGVVFCTLVFNGAGQLVGISFAPSRDGSSYAPAATVSVAGMSFTVTGLSSASKYAYNLSVADENNEELVYYRGEFATTGYEGEVVPGGEPVTPGGGTTVIDNVHPSTQSVGTAKFFRNGQLFIQRGNELFNAQGARVE